MQGLTQAKETVARIDVLLASLENSHHREMLTAFRTHWWSEVLGDIDTAMSVMPDDVLFKTTGAVPSGQPFELHSSVEQRALYQAQIDYGLTPGAGTFVDERWAFSDWGFVLEAEWIFVMFGWMLGGYGEFDKDQLYLAKIPCVAIIPYRGNGILGGEIFYFGNPIAIEPTDQATLDWIIAAE